MVVLLKAAEVLRFLRQHGFIPALRFDSCGYQILPSNNACQLCLKYKSDQNEILYLKRMKHILAEYNMQSTLDEQTPCLKVPIR